MIISLFLIRCHTEEHQGVIIQGYVKNSNQEYIVLTHVPRFRGNLNFDNFKSIGTTIDKKGNFKVESETITHGSNYSLEYKNRGIELSLFKGDNIHLQFDLNNPGNSLYATGKGAGKINVINLKQFEHVSFDPNWSINDFHSFSDSLVSSQLDLLEAIYSGDVNNYIGLNTTDRGLIEKIIVETPLTDAEYGFLKKRVLIKRYYLTDFITMKSKNNLLDSAIIDLTDPVFSFYNKQEYDMIDNLNDWHLANGLDQILYVEFLKDKQNINSKLTYKDWRSFSNKPLQPEWVSSYLMNTFNTEVYDKFYGDQLAWFMTLGFSYEELYKDFKEQCVNKKYLAVIDNYKNLLGNGINHLDDMVNHPEIKLNPENNTLNKTKFNSLIESYKGRPLYIVFWSAEYAGASIIKHLPSLKDFEKTYKSELEILNICIDKAENKSLWAARIIDNSWAASHYFMPIEDNDSTLIKFSDQKTSSFCNGGANYAFIDREGNINMEIGAPINLTKKEFEKYLD